jgi:hypothetical protein
MGETDRSAARFGRQGLAQRESMMANDPLLVAAAGDAQQGP